MENEPSNKRRSVTLDVVGGGRGAQRMQASIAEFNRESTSVRLEPTYIDPERGKAHALAVRGQEKFGLRTSAVEERGEAFLKKPGRRAEDLVVVSIDDAEGVGRLLEMELQSVLLTYNVTDFPGLGLIGLMSVLTPEDLERKQELSRAYRHLARYVSPSGSNEVVGSESPLLNRLSEDRLRTTFANHFRRNVGKILTSLQPETAPVEIILDGQRAIPLEVMESGSGWRTEQELLVDLERSLRVPIRRGAEICVFELGENGIRVHQVRFQRTDGRFALVRNRVQSPRPEAVPTPVSEVNKLNAAFLSD